MSVNIALVRMVYPAASLGRGVGLNALVVGVGFAAGPSVASTVLAFGNWPWLLAINVPLGLLALPFALPALPRSEPHDHRFDPLKRVSVDQISTDDGLRLRVRPILDRHIYPRVWDTFPSVCETGDTDSADAAGPAFVKVPCRAAYTQSAAAAD